MVLSFTYRRGRKLSNYFTLDEYKMLSKCNSSYITKFPINLRTILWKYERWSNLHKEIEEKFKELSMIEMNCALHTVLFLVNYSFFWILAWLSIMIMKT